MFGRTSEGALITADAPPPRLDLPAEILPVVVRVLDALPVEAIVDRALAEVRAQVPQFRELDRERTRHDMVTALSLAARALRPGADTGGEDQRVLFRVGRLRAEQGIRLESILVGFRIIARTAVDAVLDIARDQEVDPETTLRLTRAVWEYCDLAASALATGHRSQTPDPATDARQRQETLLRRLVSGSVPPVEVAAACAALGLDGAVDYYVVVARGRRSGEPPVAQVADRLTAAYTDSSDSVVGVTPVLPMGTWEGHVGYGYPRPPARFAESFAQARQAAELARTFSLDEPQSWDDVLLLKPVRDMPDVGDECVERCFGHLDDGRLRSTRETLEAWFAAEGVADLAAEQLFVHRNTLRYRLRTFTASTGLRLDRPEDAFMVWWALKRLAARDSAGR